MRSSHELRGDRDHASRSRSIGRDADRQPDGGCDHPYLRRSRTPLRIRHSCPAPLHGRHSPFLGAGIVHLHVRLDGEVRCCLRRAHRHPCRGRRGARTRGRAFVLPHRLIRIAVRGALHRRHRHVRHPLCLAHGPHRRGLTRPRTTVMDRLSRHSRRQLPHVLPVPAGCFRLRAHGRAAAP
jgi:hypothetical protein